MEDYPQRKIKGIWIPIEIWKNKLLSWNEKILLMEIDSCTTEFEDCYFSNKYISELLGVTETFANKLVSSLISKGYITKTKFDGRHRYVRTNIKITTKNDELGLFGSASQGCTKLQGCIAAEYNPAILYSINNNNKGINNRNKKEEDTNVSPKKNDYKAIIDCWNECNGKRLGKVTKITQRRKDAIKKALLDNDITQEQLMQFFKTLPFADSWLYNPNKQHKNWKPDFDWWLSNPNGWLTKGLEGKVHLENPQAYSSIMGGDDAPYTPICEGALSWNDYYSSFIFVGYWDGVHIPDGYTDETRPNGATIMLNNGRGNITWNKNTKQWEKV